MAQGVPPWCSSRLVGSARDRASSPLIAISRPPEPLHLCPARPVGTRLKEHSGRAISMVWTVETVSAVDAEIEALPVKMRARLIRLLEMVENIGLEALRAPPSFATLRRYAEATGTRLTVGLVQAELSSSAGFVADGSR